MFKTFGINVILIAALVAACLTPVAPAGAVDNYVEVKNNYKVSTWAIFKCYTNAPWEQNSCRYENTYIFIKPGHSHTWKYKYTKGMGCQKINIRYGRADRSCDACEKRLDITFAENEAKRFEIDSSGSGDLDFIIKPIRGTIVN